MTPIDTKRWCSECEHYQLVGSSGSGCPRNTRKTPDDQCTNYTPTFGEEEEEMERIEESTFTQELPCHLTQEEMLQRSRRAAQIVKEIEDEQASAKSAASRFKAKIEQLSGEARVIAIEIREEKTHKDVDCKTVRDFGAKTVSEIRLDTGEVLTIRAMTFAELQRELDLKPKAPKPQDATCTAPEPAPGPAPETVQTTGITVDPAADGAFATPPQLPPKPDEPEPDAKRVHRDKGKGKRKSKPGVTPPSEIIGDGGEAL